MISCQTIFALVLRHLRVFKHDPNMLLITIAWPLLDIIIWGFLGSWIERAQPTAFAHYEATALMGVLLWQVIGRGSNQMILSLTEEIYAHNIVNLFSLPLKKSEWLLGSLAYTFLMCLITAAISLGAIALLYTSSVRQLLLLFLFYMPPLFITSAAVGLTCLSIILILGKRGSELSFVIAWFLMPFSGAYYPLEVFSSWAKWIGHCLPMHYIFTSMRQSIQGQEVARELLMTGYGLSLLYFCTTLLLFNYCFERSKEKGLARLTD